VTSIVEAWEIYMWVHLEWATLRAATLYRGYAA
jgi:hypothetical protein